MISDADTLAFASAIFCAGLALIVAWDKKRSIAHCWVRSRDGGLGRGRRFHRPDDLRGNSGRNGLLAILENGGDVISAGNLAFFQSDLCSRKLFGISETMASGSWWRPFYYPSGWSFFLANS